VGRVIPVSLAIVAVGVAVVVWVHFRAESMLAVEPGTPSPQASSQGTAGYDQVREDLRRLPVKGWDRARDSPGTCLAQRGTLHDPYRGETIAFVRGPTTSDAVQIDHVVSLADAWYKGARDWDDRRRRDFANDPRNLLAVSGKSNFDKAFRDAASWLPPNVGFRCDFVARQVGVKTAYGLWVADKEKRAMAEVLAGC
jgi:hypothetical protein